MLWASERGRGLRRCGGARSRTAVCGERDTAALVVAGDALGWAIRRRPVLADELARALAWRRAWNDFEAERARAKAKASMVASMRAVMPVWRHP